MYHDLAAGRELRQCCFDTVAKRLVDAHQELVKQKNFRALQPHHFKQNRQEQPLLHAKRQVFDPGEFLFGQGTEIQDPGQALFCFPVAQSRQRSVEKRIVANGQCRRRAVLAGPQPTATA